MRTLLRQVGCSHACDRRLGDCVLHRSRSSSHRLPPSPCSSGIRSACGWEAQLAQGRSRTHPDPQRAGQIYRIEATANRQQAEVDRLVAEVSAPGMRRRGFFALFGRQPPQCGPLNNQILQIRGSLDQV